MAITAAPGAFTPTCTEQHIPDYIKHIKDFKAKWVPRIIVLTSNDPFVLSAWPKALGYKDTENYVIFALDPNCEILSSLGEDFVVDTSGTGFGKYTARWVRIVDDGKVSFIGNEKGMGFSDSSSAETVLTQM